MAVSAKFEPLLFSVSLGQVLVEGDKSPRWGIIFVSFFEILNDSAQSCRFGVSVLALKCRPRKKLLMWLQMPRINVLDLKFSPIFDRILRACGFTRSRTAKTEVL